MSAGSIDDVIARAVRPAFRLLGLALIVSILFGACTAVCACAMSEPPSPSEAGSAGPSLTPVPNGASPDGQGSGGAATQSETAWGRIWDRLPDSFPLPQGAIATDAGEGTVSGSFAIGASADQAAEFMMARLQAAGYTFESAEGPAEDGGMTLNAIAAAGCAVQIRLTPLSGTTRMTVMYGAACPFQ